MFRTESCIHQLSSCSQAHLTRKNELVFWRDFYFDKNKHIFSTENSGGMRNKDTKKTGKMPKFHQ